MAIIRLYNSLIVIVCQLSSDFVRTNQGLLTDQHNTTREPGIIWRAARPRRRPAGRNHAQPFARRSLRFPRHGKS